jgi:hypothetical protein
VTFRTLLECDARRNLAKHGISFEESSTVFGDPRSGEQRGSELTIDTPNASKSLSFRNQSIEDSSNLPDPDVIAQEIVEDLQTALAANNSAVEAMGNSESIREQETN